MPHSADDHISLHSKILSINVYHSMQDNQYNKLLYFMFVFFIVTLRHFSKFEVFVHDRHDGILKTKFHKKKKYKS